MEKWTEAWGRKNESDTGTTAATLNYTLIKACNSHLHPHSAVGRACFSYRICYWVKCVLRGFICFHTHCRWVCIYKMYGVDYPYGQHS